MKRREFIKILGGAAGWPVAAYAQQRSALPVIAYLNGQEQAAATVPAAFRKGLAEMAYIEGKNVDIELHTTSQVDRLPVLVAELVQRQVAVIFAQGLPNGAQVAKAATATIPIVFFNGGDPVRLGLVASIARPGGNVTGITSFSGTLVAKRLEQLRELVPQATTIGFLTNPTNLLSAGNMSDLLAAARTVGQQIIVLKASTTNEIDAAFAAAAQQHIGALIIDSAGVLFGNSRDQILALAARYRIPASYSNPYFVKAGGLMTYSDDRSESLRQAGIYVGRILKGEKPADLPVLQPAKFELVIDFNALFILVITQGLAKRRCQTSIQV